MPCRTVIIRLLDNNCVNERKHFHHTLLDSLLFTLLKNAKRWAEFSLPFGMCEIRQDFSCCFRGTEQKGYF